VGLSLGVNWVNALVAGILGVPGVVLLIVIKYLF
jgi:inhibitor of the pro-sigma K processing machinery